LSEVLLGFFVNGFFPIFPWIIYPVAGFVFASWMYAEPRPPVGVMLRVAALGLSLIAVAVAAELLRPYSPAIVQDVWLKKGWTMFPASAIYVLETLGLAVAAAALCHLWIDPSPRFAIDSRLAGIAST